MEITSSVEKLAQNWKLKIRDWNLNAGLPAGLVLADGKKVSEDKQGGFYDHGTGFGQVIDMKFGNALREVDKLHPEGNSLAVFPYKGDQEIVWYKFTNFRQQTPTDKRSGYSGAELYLLFNKGEGEKFVQQVKEEPTLIDALVAAKFPELVTKVGIKPWRELLYLPADLFFKDIDKQVEIIAKVDN